MKKIRCKVCLIMLLSIGLSGMFTKECRADKIYELQESIQSKQDAISSAQNEKNALQSGLTDVKSVLSNLQTEKKNLSNYIYQLDNSLTEVETSIDNLNTMIEEKEDQIEATKLDLQAAQDDADVQYEAMKKRIKFMYERGETFYLDMLITSKSFGEMLNKADYVEQLSAYDRNMLEEYKMTVALVTACSNQLDAEQETLEAAKKEVEEQQGALQELIDAKGQEIQAYDANISDQASLVKEYEAEISSQNAEIAALEAAVAAEKKALEEAQNPVESKTYDGGMFAWPAPSYTRISDDYGNRMHPTLHVEKFHNGVDMAAPGGSPILAAYDGTVVAAAYSTTMGNYVMIDHGSNMYTIYMHASSLSVSKGQTVVKGQQIGGVGSTGRSTGNHLHFSVRVNGSYVSPWNYLSK